MPGEPSAPSMPGAHNAPVTPPASAQASSDGLASTKEAAPAPTVEDLLAPISGVVTARNEAVLNSPEELQNDPYGEGWLLIVQPSDSSELDTLLDAASYSQKLEAH